MSELNCPRCSRECWKPVKGFESYQISDHGRLRSKVGRLMRPSKLRRGHLRVSLNRDKTRFSFQVHHLVLIAFVAPRPEGLEGLHNNDDPADNCFKNLRWGTHSDNMKDAVKNGRMLHVHPKAIREEIVAAIGDGASVREEAQRCGLPRRTIYGWLHEANVAPARPSDKRALVVQEVLNGATVRAVAEKYNLSIFTIYPWLRAVGRHRKKESKSL